MSSTIYKGYVIEPECLLKPDGNWSESWKIGVLLQNAEVKWSFDHSAKTLDEAMKTVDRLSFGGLRP